MDTLRGMLGKPGIRSRFLRLSIRRFWYTGIQVSRLFATGSRLRGQECKGVSDPRASRKPTAVPAEAYSHKPVAAALHHSLELMEELFAWPVLDRRDEGATVRHFFLALPVADPHAAVDRETALRGVDAKFFGATRYSVTSSPFRRIIGGAPTWRDDCAGYSAASNPLILLEQDYLEDLEARSFVHRAADQSVVSSASDHVVIDTRPFDSSSFVVTVFLDSATILQLLSYT